MKVSLRWICDYVDVTDFLPRPDDLAQLLTRAGIEVDAIENMSQRFAHVVVGHIVEYGRHPDADRLTVCQVDTGEGQLRQIVCGAKNHKKGDKVVAALPGAVLPGDFAIKQSKIRGVESAGMLCSDKELGLSGESEGIRILPTDAPIGQAIAEYMGLDDVIFELSVTPNRADCLSHFGLARELGCLLDRPALVPEANFKTSSVSTKAQVKLSHKDTELCPRYAGRSMTGVKVGPSPEWLKQRLESVGLNSINNVVDVTNYVMLELGQPLHAFDAQFLKGREVIIAKAKPGEKFISLDGTPFSLKGEELTIRDGEKPVALAGVVGGKNSGVSESTAEIFLESAHFTPQTVRRTSREFGIETDSAYRFSRGTDPESVVVALNRACQLIQETAGGEVAKDHYDSYPQPLKRDEIVCHLDRFSQKLGFDVEPDQFEVWMKRLGCEVKKSSGAYRVTPPKFRWDLNIEEDLMEEFARLQGYENIPETFPEMTTAPSHHVADYQQERQLSIWLRSLGFAQAINYNFIGESFLRGFLGPLPIRMGIEISDQLVKIRNPLSEDLNVMRNSLLPSLFKDLLDNYRYGQLEGRLFELGRAFSRSGSDYVENHRLALIGWGQSSSLWRKESDRPVVFDIKGAVESVLVRLKSNSWQWRSVEAKDVPSFLHSGQCAALFYEGKMAGFVGTLHPSLRAEHKIRHDVAVAELDIATLMRGQPRAPKVKPLSRFPMVERDFAFLLPDDLAAGEVVKYIEKVGGESLQSVEVFDVYKGSGLPEGRRSVAFRLVYQSQQETLTDDQLTALQKKVIDEVSRKFSVEVR